MKRHLVPHLLHPACTLWSYSGEDNTDKLIFIRIIAFTFTLFSFHLLPVDPKVAKYSTVNENDRKKKNERNKLKTMEQTWARDRDEESERKYTIQSSFEWAEHIIWMNMQRTGTKLSPNGSVNIEKSKQPGARYYFFSSTIQFTFDRYALFKQLFNTHPRLPTIMQ